MESQQVTEHAARHPVLWWYVAAIAIFAGGAGMGMRAYPHGYDWFYMVASSLANRAKNPVGGIWFASGWTVSMLLLFHCATLLKRQLPRPSPRSVRFASKALQIGLVFFAVTGFDMVVNGALLGGFPKGHELFAFIGFLATYLGVLGLLIHVLRAKRFPALPVLLLATPLVAIGATQFWLYLKQRHLGWVGPDWRAMGIPIWLSFAFWQWLAIGFLLAGIGLLVWVQSADTRQR